MQKLPLKFKSQGDCQLLARTDDWAIIERIPTNATKTIYEVHAIAKNKAWECHGNTIPAKETIQPATQFGSKAWTKTTREAAFELFFKLAKEGSGL